MTLAEPLFDPFTPEAFDDPHPQYRRLRAEAPVLWSDRLRSWVLFGYRDVHRFFSDPALSADRSLATKYEGERDGRIRGVGSESPEHTPVRAAITRSLYPMVAQLLPTVEGLVDDMVDVLARSIDRFLDESARLRNGGAAPGADPAQRADLIRDFAYPLPITVIADLFGVPETDRAQFQDWSHTLARRMDRFYRHDGERSFDAFAGYFADLVAERRRRPGDDLVSRMLEANLADRHGVAPLSDAEYVGLCTTLIFAGHETTTNLLGNGMLALLRHPAQHRRLTADPRGTAETAVEELLRFDSPAQMISRTVIAETGYGDQVLRPGDAVLGVIGSANHDEAEFGPDADELDVGRSPNYHLAFGLGRHFCPGARLSRLEARVAFPALLERFPDLRLIDGDPPVYRPTAVLRGLEHLPVTLDTH
ncbi:MAG: cytochrome P450 [Acidimicrobiales bacterium]